MIRETIASTKLTLTHEDGNYINRNIRETATIQNILDFVKAISELQTGAPEKVIKTVKSELMQVI